MAIVDLEGQETAEEGENPGERYCHGDANPAFDGDGDDSNGGPENTPGNDDDDIFPGARAAVAVSPDGDVAHGKGQGDEEGPAVIAQNNDSEIGAQDADRRGKEDRPCSAAKCRLGPKIVVGGLGFDGRDGDAAGNGAEDGEEEKIAKRGEKEKDHPERQSSIAEAFQSADETDPDKRNGRDQQAEQIPALHVGGMMRFAEMSEGEPKAEKTPMLVKGAGDEAVEIKFDGDAEEADEGVFSAAEGAVPGEQIAKGHVILRTHL